MTRLERTGWRDGDLSQRHRLWGYDCPAVDIDFLMIEFDLGRSVGLVDYKHYRAELNFNSANVSAMRDLATRAKVACWVAVYWPECWAFRIYSLEPKAVSIFGDKIDLTECQYVKSLYHLRNIVRRECSLPTLDWLAVEREIAEATSLQKILPKDL